jgi:hypothetical protein
MNKKPKTMKIGEYDVRVVKKGVETTSLPVKEGEVYYMIRLDKHSWMDVQNQINAEIISRLVRIENLLKKNDDGVGLDFIKEMKKTENRKPNKKETFISKLLETRE